jgi:hypothetical protein
MLDETKIAEIANTWRHTLPGLSVRKLLEGMAVAIKGKRVARLKKDAELSTVVNKVNELIASLEGAGLLEGKAEEVAAEVEIETTEAA